MGTNNTNQEKLMERRRKVVPNAIGVFNPATAVSAEGAIITDLDGRPMIDFAAGIGVMNAGHCPKPVVKAVQAQAAKLMHTCFNVAMYDGYIELAEKLVELLPHGDETKVMLTNSGAEAVENAIKIARQATGKAGILCFTGAFHGRSMMAMSLTAKVGNKYGCGPFAGEVYRIDFPNYFRYGQGLSEEKYIDKEIQKLHDFFLTYADGSNMAAAIIEIVQGEGGFNVVPPRYLKALREVCDAKGMMLIIDEVQTGFGRTGKWAAYEHYDVRPDISTWAKAMGGGMPIGCVMGKADIMDKAKPGTLGGTYLGNPVCCAASLATLNYMQKIDINKLGDKVGKIINRRFKEMAKKFPQHIGNVRGIGAMQAMEFVKNGNPWQPDGELVANVVKGCEENGLIIISAGTYGNVIRALCPLVIKETDLRRGLDILESQIEKYILK
jgi:4-aminobutyrate aminotransferase / (S)-3-amino-2-methylpropionate transaminase / 5-aminovalerate transaminase